MTATPTTPRAVAYVRVSTDDRGQDPARQLEVIRPWCEREGVLLLDVITDEGTSASKTDPFERKKFLAACARAKAIGATALVVECSDRFSRQGSKIDAWAEVQLERVHGLRLLRADKTLAAHGSMIGNVGDSIHAEGAKAWAVAHGQKVSVGMAKKKRDEGKTWGRPPKPLTPAEVEKVKELRAKGDGWRLCAEEVSRMRGRDRVADKDAKRKRSVSHSHVRRCFEALGLGGTKVEVEQKSRNAAE